MGEARRIVVVGGTSGLGQAIAEAHREDGDRVAVLGRTASASGGEDTLAVPVDITDASAVEAAFEEIATLFGGLDIAINAAGAVGPVRPVAEVTGDELGLLLAVNVLGIHRVMQHEIRLMEPQGGVILNVSSNIGLHVNRPSLGAYGASKAALTALSRTAALELAGTGIRVAVLSPGASDTAMSMRPGEDRTARDRRIAKVHPLGRVASLDEIVAAARYLTSPHAGSTVGADLVVDGGSSL